MIGRWIRVARMCARDGRDHPSGAQGAAKYGHCGYAFMNPGMLEQLREGKMPLSMAAHEKVLKAYNVSTIFLAREVAIVMRVN